MSLAAISLIAMTLITGSMTACGSAHQIDTTKDHGKATSTSAQRAGLSIPTIDREGDFDNPTKAYYDRDDYFGEPANAIDRQAITHIVGLYYQFAAADDGTSACTLLYPVAIEALVDSYEQSSSLHGKGCATILSHTFKARNNMFVLHKQMLKIIAVRTANERGWAVMTFGTRHERHLLMRRYHNAWKVAEPLDSDLP